MVEEFKSNRQYTSSILVVCMHNGVVETIGMACEPIWIIFPLTFWYSLVLGVIT
jgi:hypothetical protein